jgi:hypothetical protein
MFMTDPKHRPDFRNNFELECVLGFILIILEKLSKPADFDWMQCDDPVFLQAKLTKETNWRSFAMPVTHPKLIICLKLLDCSVYVYFYEYYVTSHLNEATLLKINMTKRPKKF